MNYSANGVIAIGMPGSEARQRQNLNAFMSMYVEELHRAIQMFPAEYAYPESEVDQIAERMMSAFIGKTYNKDSRAIKAVCKRLGLKHTYKVINAFLGGQ